VAEVQPGEEVVEGQDISKVERARTVVADVYTFVRAQESNRTIASFTLDHYIDEAKRRIKGEGRQVRSASGESIDIRPTKLEALEKLEAEFTASLDLIESLAKTASQAVAETAAEDEE
jgi:hypothetical protein